MPLLSRGVRKRKFLSYSTAAKATKESRNSSRSEWDLENREEPLRLLWRPETSRTPPPHWYFQREFHGLEKRSNAFRNSWLYVGHAEELRNPGDYIAGNIVDQPYLVLKDEENRLRGFLNVCRHHAAELLPKGSGKLPDCDKIVCPYHGWTYGSTTGRLLRATRLKGIEEFRASEIGLVPILVDRFGPLIFINFDASDGSSSSSSKSSLAEDLKPVQDAMKEHEQQSKQNDHSLQFISRKFYPIQCNWKVFVENYLDGGYHVNHLHPGLNSQLDSSSYTTTCFDRVSLQCCRPKVESKKTTDDLGVDFSERIGSGSVYAFSYPNFMMNRYGNFLDVNFVIPTGVSSCVVQYDYFYDFQNSDVPEKDLPEFLERSLIASDKVQQEDTSICESVQRGLGSLAYERHSGRYAPNVEFAMFHFHKLLHEDLSREKS